MAKKLYVGNLSFSTTEQELHSKFAALGEVSSAKIIVDRESGRSKGFGFVEMTDDSAADRAINEFNGQDFGGRNMIVSEARPQGDRPSFGGRGGGGGGGGGGRRGGFGGPRGGDRGSRGGDRY